MAAPVFALPGDALLEARAIADGKTLALPARQHLVAALLALGVVEEELREARGELAKARSRARCAEDGQDLAEASHRVTCSKLVTLATTLEMAAEQLDRIAGDDITVEAANSIARTAAGQIRHVLTETPR